MEITEVIYCRTVEEWRYWLEDNHSSVKEIWLLYYKVNSGKPSIDYLDSVDEALCYGWVDGLLKSYDSLSYVRRFTPRRKNSKWGENYKKRILKLIDEGRVKKEGLKSIENVDFSPRKIPEIEFPKMSDPSLDDFLEMNGEIKVLFNKLATSHKKNYYRWVGEAKTIATKNKRFLEIATRMINK